MTILRYSRALTPADIKSVPSWLNFEHLKLERSIDSIRGNVAVLNGGNTFTGDQTFNDGNLLFNGGKIVVHSNGDVTEQSLLILQALTGGYASMTIRNSGATHETVIFGPSDTDNTAYWDADHIILEDTAEANVYADFTKDDVHLKTNNADRLHLTNAGANVIGVLTVGGTNVTPDNTQAAIANDSSGAANQATVNAILAALRANNIIAP